MQHNQAQSTVESLLQAHSVATEQVRVLCRSAGRYWIHQQSCEALASTYKQALQKLTSMLTLPLLSYHLNAHELQLRVQPALDMVLAAIHQGKHFLETCRPSPTDLAKCYSVRHRASCSSPGKSSASSVGEDFFLSTIADDKSWLLRALLKGCATDAIDVHLHDFLIAFSAVGAAIHEDMAPITIGRMVHHSADQVPSPDTAFPAVGAIIHEDNMAPITYIGRMIQLHSADQVPSPDLFWRDQNKPHVLLVSAQHLDHAKRNDDTVLNSQLEYAMNLRGYPDDVDTTQQKITTITMAADVDAAQLAAFVKEKIKCAKQAFHESIDPSFLDIKKLEVDNSPIFSVHTTSVHKVMWLGREFALKVYYKKEETFLQEAKIHVRLHHPNVVHAVALYKGEKEYGILMELMDENLKSFLQRHTFSLRLQEKVSIMLQIAKGMAYVHGRGVIHRDLKPSNVLVRSSMGTQASGIQKLEVKVADFGESNSRLPDSSSFTTKRIGTSVYRAPEVLNDNRESSNFTSWYKSSADVYSFAMTCFELLVENEPFHDSEKRQALWDRVILGERPDLASISDDACPPYLKHCLKTWWADDPKTRHSFTHICCILRHMYMCLARCQSDTEPIVQFPFLAWPYWRWRYAQEIAQQRLHEFEIRRANEDWKDKGYWSESTRVNEIPYELHVMKWAIKKAADIEAEAAIYKDAPHSEFVNRRPENVNPRVPAATAPPTSANEGISSSTSTAGKSLGQKIKEFCCFAPARSILPSTHEAFHDDILRRN